MMWAAGLEPGSLRNPAPATSCPGRGIAAELQRESHDPPPRPLLESSRPSRPRLLGSKKTTTTSRSTGQPDMAGAGFVLLLLTQLLVVLPVFRAGILSHPSAGTGIGGPGVWGCGIRGWGLGALFILCAWSREIRRRERARERERETERRRDGQRERERGNNKQTANIHRPIMPSLHSLLEALRRTDYRVPSLSPQALDPQPFRLQSTPQPIVQVPVTRAVDDGRSNWGSCTGQSSRI